MRLFKRSFRGVRGTIEENRVNFNKTKAPLEESKAAIEEIKIIIGESKATIVITKTLIEETKVIIEESKAIIVITKILIEESKVIFPFQIIVAEEVIFKGRSFIFKNIILNLHRILPFRVHLFLT